MTLRARLTAVLVVLVAVGLIVADVATYAALRSFLLRRVDQQLHSAVVPAAIALNHPISGGGPQAGPPDEPAIPSGTYAALFDANDRIVLDRFPNQYQGAQNPSKPKLPFGVDALGASDPAAAVPFTVGAVGGSLRYRVVVTSVQGGGAFVVAIPLTEMTDTLHSLEWIALVVTLGVIAAMAAISWWTVRRGLRPLEKIEQTAGAIAAGDLSQRIEETDPRTEVGRLGGALNVMLGRIEDAMHERLASEEALRRFLADASHELRTPLTSIRGYAELFRRGAEDDPQDTALAMRRIEQESQRMGSLVEDLLFLARAGEGRPLATGPVDLSRIVADMVTDARVVDPERRIDVSAPPELIVTGDEGRLRQVLANLLSNVLVHTPSDAGIEVRLRAEAGSATLDVADQGPGLVPEVAAHIFEPFYRADMTRGRDHGPDDAAAASGAGLGLSIVAAIAEAHGGEASVKSEPGAGATFTVRIPIDPPDREIPSALAPDSHVATRITIEDDLEQGLVGTEEVEEDV